MADQGEKLYAIKTTSKSWDGAASRYTDEEYKRACLIDRGGDGSTKERCSLPVREPDGTLNTNALGAAAGRIGSLANVTDAQKATAARKLRSLYRAAGQDVPDSLKSYGEAAPLETVDLEGVDIMAAGKRIFGSGACPPEGEVYSVGGEDPAHDLTRIAADTNKLLDELRPANKWKSFAPNKIGHGTKQLLAYSTGLYDEAEDPALGWIENCRVSEDGRLLVDIKNVPKRFADLIKAGAFRQRSPEIASYKSHEDGEEYPAVLRGLAWLGATQPAFKTLDDVAALYQGGEPAVPTGQLLYADQELDGDSQTKALNYASAELIWDTEASFQDLMRELNQALNPGPGYSNYWVNDISFEIGTDDQGDPQYKALVCESGSGVTWVVPFEIENDRATVSPSSDWVMAEPAWVAADDGKGGGSGSDQPGSDYRERKRGARAETRRMPEDTGNGNGTETQELSEETRGFLSKLFGGREVAEGDDLVRLFAEAAGVPEETDPEKIREAITGAKAEADKPVEAKIPEGMKLMSEADVAKLSEGAETAARIAEELRVERRDNYLRSQERQGKFTPAEREEWAKHYDENPEITKAALEKLPVDETLKTYGADDAGDRALEIAATAAGEEFARAWMAHSGIQDLPARPAVEAGQEANTP